MENKCVVWLDERTSDYLGRNWDFKEGIESRNVKLIVCGEGNEKGMDKRAIACNTTFRKTLHNIVDTGKQNEVIGFIVDVNMPIEDLSIYDEGLSSISTSIGAYTGFKVAQYIIANNRRNLSPYGDAFKDKPILFLSISQYHNDPNTQWMRDEYSDYASTGKFTKYSHLQKTVHRKSIREDIKAWVDFCKQYRNP